LASKDYRWEEVPPDSFSPTASNWCMGRSFAIQGDYSWAWGEVLPYEGTLTGTEAARCVGKRLLPAAYVYYMQVLLLSSRLDAKFILRVVIMCIQLAMQRLRHGY